MSHLQPESLQCSTSNLNPDQTSCVVHNQAEATWQQAATACGGLKDGRVYQVHDEGDVTYLQSRMSSDGVSGTWLGGQVSSDNPEWSWLTACDGCNTREITTECKQRELSLTVMLDQSFYVSNTGYQQMSSFAADIITPLHITSSVPSAQVTVISYSDEANVEIYAAQYNDTDLFQTALRSLERTNVNGISNLTSALQLYTADTLQDSDNSDTTADSSVIAFIVGNQTSSHTTSLNSVLDFRSRGIDVMVIGVGSSVDLPRLQQLAGSSGGEGDAYWVYQNYDELAQDDVKLRQIHGRLCSTGAAAGRTFREQSLSSQGCYKLAPDPPPTAAPTSSGGAPTPTPSGGPTDPTASPTTPQPIIESPTPSSRTTPTPIIETTPPPTTPPTLHYNLTHQLCKALCSTGTTKHYSLLKSGRECLCYDSIHWLVPGGSCTTPCSGDASQRCGGDEDYSVLVTKDSGFGEWSAAVHVENTPSRTNRCGYLSSTIDVATGERYMLAQGHCFLAKSYICSIDMTKCGMSQPTGWTIPYRSSCYYISHLAMDWYSAHVFCSSLSGHVVSVDNADLLSFLRVLLTGEHVRDYWVALAGNVLRWKSPSSSEYPDWITVHNMDTASTIPGNTGNMCLLSSAQGDWTTEPCDSTIHKHPYYCQYTRTSSSDKGPDPRPDPHPFPPDDDVTMISANSTFLPPAGASQEGEGGMSTLAIVLLVVCLVLMIIAIVAFILAWLYYRKYRKVVPLPTAEDLNRETKANQAPPHHKDCKGEEAGSCTPEFVHRDVFLSHGESEEEGDKDEVISMVDETADYHYHDSNPYVTVRYHTRDDSGDDDIAERYPTGGVDDIPAASVDSEDGDKRGNAGASCKGGDNDMNDRGDDNTNKGDDNTNEGDDNTNEGDDNTKEGDCMIQIHGEKVAHLESKV